MLKMDASQNALELYLMPVLLFSRALIMVRSLMIETVSEM